MNQAFYRHIMSEAKDPELLEKSIQGVFQNEWQDVFADPMLKDFTYQNDYQFSDAFLQKIDDQIEVWRQGNTFENQALEGQVPARISKPRSEFQDVQAGVRNVAWESYYSRRWTEPEQDAIEDMDEIVIKLTDLHIHRTLWLFQSCRPGTSFPIRPLLVGTIYVSNDMTKLPDLVVAGEIRRIGLLRGLLHGVALEYHPEDIAHFYIRQGIDIQSIHTAWKDFKKE